MVEVDQSVNVTINVENIIPEGIDVFDDNEEEKKRMRNKEDTRWTHL